VTPYEKHLAEHRRITILRLLAGEDGQVGAGTANESILFDCLEAVGLEAALTRQAVRDDLKWMEAHDLVRTEMVGGQLMVATITQRGVDCARGRIIVEGVKKPSLGVL
jgi:hypothetical protein